ncbi:MAG: hypothetical protein K2M79_02030, partial [Muribaculaceae bacterium]|nr:hypothetical protein [Muribaculaceae bacterium]
MKSKLYITVIASVFAALLLSCGESENARILREADEIIETDPSKSLEILSQAQRQDFSAADSAYYALLYTQAQVKSGVRVLSDTLISVAYDYYKDRNEGDLSERAYFYRGMTFYDSNNYREAMKDMLAAYDLADANNHPYWKAKSAEVISDIFIAMENFPQAELYSLDAVHNYTLSYHNSNLRYALCDLAGIYLNNNKPELCVAILDSLHSLVEAEYPTNFNLLEYMQTCLVAGLINTGRTDEIKNEYFTSIYSDSIPQSVIDRNLLLVRLSCINENFDDAANAIERAEKAVTTDEQSREVIYRKFLLKFQEKNYPEAAILADTLIKLQDSLTYAIVNEATGSAISEYYSEKAERGAERSKKLSEWLITVCLFSGIALIIFFLIYLLKTRQRKT